MFTWYAGLTYLNEEFCSSYCSKTWLCFCSCTAPSGQDSWQGLSRWRLAWSRSKVTKRASHIGRSFRSRDPGLAACPAEEDLLVNNIEDVNLRWGRIRIKREEDLRRARVCVCVFLFCREYFFVLVGVLVCFLRCFCVVFMCVKEI